MTAHGAERQDGAAAPPAGTLERGTIPRPIPRRDPDTHKGTYGRLLLVAGSDGMPGAAILAARGALRAGAGLIYAAIPSSIAASLGAAVPEAVQVWARESWSPPADLDPTAAAVGPGLTRDRRARSLVEFCLARFDRPVVVDADALNIVSETPDLTRAHRPDRIWTPHPGEFERLTGERPRGDAQRAEAAARFVRRFGGVLVLKGHRTVVADGSHLYVNTTGNPGMATAGAGDVLTGILGALLAQGLPPFDAASLGVYLHGLAGDLAASRLGETSLIASDIVEHLPAAILQHQRAP